MAVCKVTELGLLPPDHPIFRGGVGLCLPLSSVLTSEASPPDGADHSQRCDMSEDVVATAIAADIEALADLLREMTARVEEARGYTKTGQRNAAIGTVLDLGPMLADATALHGAVLALHRRRPA